MADLVAGVGSERRVQHAAWLNGTLVQGPTSGLNYSSWVQCSADSPWVGPNVNTASYGDGTPLKLAYQAENAAGNWCTSSTSTNYVDNSPVALTLSGPTDAPVTAGTQYITATATAGPSGIGSITCSVDGSAWAARTLTGGGTRSATTQIPVSGLGSHQVTCYATNQAIDVSGTVANSPTETWSISIREPVSGGITFSQVMQHRQRIHTRALIPTHWVTIRRGHKLRRVRRHARNERRWLTTCTTRTLLSDVAHRAHGKGATVSGWFASVDGAPLGNALVNIMAASDNGSYAWTTAATATTSATGTWQATLPAGPSRLVEAVYAGGPLTEPAASAVIRLIVPAKIAVSITPRSAPWRGSITIRGHLIGGYVPADGVALRLLIRYRGARQPTDLLAFRTTASGRFRIRFTFGGGYGVVSYRLWIATTGGESDYPFSATASKQLSVTFGR